jgi:cytochrome c-type biogenesis protein CcmH
MSSIVSRTTAFAVLFLLVMVKAGASAPADADPELDRRVTALASELRCVVCQNQTLADSSAGLATDLKNEIRERMRQGESDAEIVAFLVERYGEFVLYRPPLKASTVVLWVGPGLLLALALIGLYRRLRVHDESAAPVLSREDRERAAQLLAAGNERNAP